MGELQAAITHGGTLRDPGRETTGEQLSPLPGNVTSLRRIEGPGSHIAGNEHVLSRRPFEESAAKLKSHRRVVPSALDPRQCARSHPRTSPRSCKVGHNSNTSSFMSTRHIYRPAPLIPARGTLHRMARKKKKLESSFKIHGARATNFRPFCINVVLICDPEKEPPPRENLFSPTILLLAHHPDMPTRRTPEKP